MLRPPSLSWDMKNSGRWALSSGDKPAPVAKDLSGGVVSRCPAHAATRMGPRSAEVEAVHGSPVAGPPGDGPEDEELVQRHLPVIDVALREAESAFQIRGGQHLPRDDELLETGHVIFEDADDTIGESFPSVLPRAWSQVVRSVLDQRGQDVLSRRRESRIHDRRDEDVEEGAAGRAPILRFVLRPFEILDRGADPEV